MHGLEWIGAFAFAMSGALLGIRKQFDVIGVLLLAIVSAYGGGILRDVLLGATPPAALTDIATVAIPFAATVTSMAFAKRWTGTPAAMLLFDAVGLAVFSVLGTVKALDHGLPIGAAVALGAITGAGGGLLRDIIARQEPLAISADAELYTVPALVGSAIAAFLHTQARPPAVVLVTSVTVIFAFRALAIMHSWRSPNITHVLSRQRAKRRSAPLGVLPDPSPVNAMDEKSA